MNVAIQQWGNTAALSAGLFSNDLDLVGRSVEDHVAEPYRAILIPHFADVKKAALDHGAIACSISGSGPSIFAMCNGKTDTKKIADAMRKIYSLNKIKSDSYISTVNKGGVKII